MLLIIKAVDLRLKFNSSWYYSIISALLPLWCSWSGLYQHLRWSLELPCEFYIAFLPFRSKGSCWRNYWRVVSYVSMESCLVVNGNLTLEFQVLSKVHHECASRNCSQFLLMAESMMAGSFLSKWFTHFVTEVHPLWNCCPQNLTWNLSLRVFSSKSLPSSIKSCRFAFILCLYVA